MRFPQRNGARARECAPTGKWLRALRVIAKPSAVWERRVTLLWNARYVIDTAA
jgi:hypothetical protein